MFMCIAVIIPMDGDGWLWSDACAAFARLEVALRGHARFRSHDFRSRDCLQGLGGPGILLFIVSAPSCTIFSRGCAQQDAKLVSETGCRSISCRPPLTTTSRRATAPSSRTSPPSSRSPIIVIISMSFIIIIIIMMMIIIIEEPAAFLKRTPALLVDITNR